MSARRSPLSPLFEDHVVEVTCMHPRSVARGRREVCPQGRLWRRRSASDHRTSQERHAGAVHYWFQNELRRYARKVLSPRSVRRAGIFRPARVKQFLDYEIEEGPGRYGMRLWMLLTFEIWRRQVIEGERP